MKSHLKNEWVNELRSGKFKQRTGSLGFEDTYCCLGVFCKINEIDFIETQNDNILNQITNKFINVAAYTAVRDLLGQDHVVPMSMNDDGKSFSEIADWIEANIKVDNEQESGAELCENEKPTL